MIRVKGFLSEKGAKVVETAVLSKKSWSKIHPDYFLKTTEKWIVLPFESNEVTGSGRPAEKLFQVSKRGRR
jgi:hypothetical protein